MKDALATALYGARGANGVILVTTKEGKEGKMNVDVRIENSFSMPTERIKTADPVTFMKMHNESVKTRDPIGQTLYTDEKITFTEMGAAPGHLSRYRLAGSHVQRRGGQQPDQPQLYRRRERGQVLCGGRRNQG